jgi:hypothetical protein
VHVLIDFLEESRGAHTWASALARHFSSSRRRRVEVRYHLRRGSWDFSCSNNRK